MSDRSPLDHVMSDEHALPGWVRAALRAPVSTDPAARSRVMARVRAAGRPTRGTGRDRARPAWASRRGLAPLAGLAAAAGFAGVVTLGALRAPLASLRSPVVGAAVAVLHDTLSEAALRPGLAGDSVGAALLRDTVRLVRFVLVAPTAARLALVGDFNGWSRDSTPMRAVAESTGTWVATLALAPGEYEYAYVVDDTGWMADPRAPRAAGAGPARSVLSMPAVGR